MTYQRPGVYVNTSLTPLSTGTTTPGQSTAAFVGVHTQGPTQPTLLTSWNDFLNIFGGFGNGQNFLPFAVWQYFANNGNECYVTRAAASDAVTATETLDDREDGTGAIQPPTGVTATPGGTVTPSYTYEYTVTATNGSGETEGGTPVQAIANQVLTVTNDVVINWTAVTGATGYSIYRRNLTVDGVTATPLLLHHVTGQATVTFTDDGSYTPAGPIPTFNSTGTPVPILKLSCVAVGSWGNQIYIDITDSTTGPGRFNLVVRYGGTADANIVERYVDVTMNRTDARYAVAMINSTLLGSKYIQATDLGTYTTWTASMTPRLQSAVALSGGSDGSATPSLVTAAQRLSTIQTNLDLNLPGVTDTLTLNPVLAWTDTQPNIFVVVDAPQAIIGSDGVTPSESATVNNYLAMVVGNAEIVPTAQVAVYAPWLEVPDPISATPGATRKLPPGGAVLGLYSQTDAQYGVQKSPAGVTIPVQRVAGVELAFQNSNLDTLNTHGVNIIRNVSSYGFCVMGARTLLPNQPNRYVSIQRTLMNITETLEQITQVAIFENNNSALWAKLGAIVTQYLQGIWQQGVLQGDTADAAYFVQCDSGNNTPTTVAAGEVHVQVGLALNSPAEFIVIDINQMASSSTTSS
jgi:phage tail sheath protein FI